ncbi:MAG: PilZ domain-containing protein, partial [Syntrophobacteria bacterium]
KSRNLGAGGAYIYCDHTPKSGELIDLTIKPPDRPSLQITAEVLWKDKVVPPGIGVRFVEISENDCQFLYNVVSNHLRSGYEKYAKE